MSPATLLYALAFICFVLAALGWPASRFNLIGLGLAFWVLVYLIPGIHA